jgi:ADP-ribosylation factor GTPase-activating protein 1
MDSYGPDGGYSKGMGMSEKYNSWAAAQYRDKLAAKCEGREWSPSPAPAQTSRPASAQATRKARGGASGYGSGYGSGAGSGVPSRTSSPYSDAPGGGGGNEAYFERMGAANASRPDHLPPSQGGKYGGFGNTPEPDAAAQHPSYGLSSRAAPTLDEFQRNPMGALSKGWGLFSSAVVTASREINESVVKPGMSRAQEMYDQGASDDVKRYFNQAGTQARSAANWAGTRAAEGWDQFNDVARSNAGVDINERLGRMGLGKGSARDQGYGQVPSQSQRDEDDFFDSWDEPETAKTTKAPLAGPSTVPKPPASKSAKKDDWDDEWKDF